jgi:hypothetical protein
VNGLSIVTVCMNRHEHLLHTLPLTARWPHHQEHLVVDWSSEQPLRRADLPADPRLRLLRVEGESQWSAALAYNFAASQARSSWLLRLDADGWIRPESPALPLLPEGSFGHLTDHRGLNGVLLVRRADFEQVGGFHERIQGYGMDDKDLVERLGRRHTPVALPAALFDCLQHDDGLRLADGPDRTQGADLRWSKACLYGARQRNLLITERLPWNAEAAHSRYLERDGVWRLQPDSRQDLPPALAADAATTFRGTALSKYTRLTQIPLQSRLAPELEQVLIDDPRLLARWQRLAGPLIDLAITALVLTARLGRWQRRRRP